MSTKIITFTLLCSRLSLSQGSFWEATSPPFSLRVLSLAIDSSGQIYVGTDSGVSVSTDHGLNWISRLSFGNYFPFTAVAVNSTGYVWAGFEGGGLMFSPDYGVTWQPSVQGVDGQVFGLTFNRVGELFAGMCFQGGCQSYRFSPDGSSYTFGSFLPWAEAEIKCYAFKPAGICFAGEFGLGVGIFRSTDNGDNWYQPDTTLTGIAVYSLVVHPNGSLFAGTSSGKILRSTNDGSNWEVVRPDPGPRISSLVVNSAGYVFAATLGNGVLRSTDHGVSWEEINTGLTNMTVYDLAIDSDEFIYVGTEGGQVFRSVESTVWVEEQVRDVPDDFSLAQNYPNPFNPLTIINFSVPSTAGRDLVRLPSDGQLTIGNWVTLRVYDVLGREVATLVNEPLPPGTHKRVFDATGLASGVYVYRLLSGTRSETKTMLLLK